MWNLVLCTLLIVALSDICNAAQKLPSNLKLCKRNNQDLSACIIENVDILRPHMKKGIPELYVPSLDPLVISEAMLNSGSSFNLTFKDIELYHLEEFIIEMCSVNLEKPQLKLKLRFKQVRIKANYIVNGKILILNLDGRGPANGNFTNVEGSLTLNGKYVKKNDKDYIEWHKELADFSIEGSDLIFEKLFGDNEELTKQSNKIINENVDAIVKELKPVIQRVISDVFFNVFNRVFTRYSTNELFPSE